MTDVTPETTALDAVTTCAGAALAASDTGPDGWPQRADLEAAVRTALKMHGEDEVADSLWIGEVGSDSVGVLPQQADVARIRATVEAALWAISGGTDARSAWSTGVLIPTRGRRGRPLPVRVLLEFRETLGPGGGRVNVAFKPDREAEESIDSALRAGFDWLERNGVLVDPAISNASLTLDDWEVRIYLGGYPWPFSQAPALEAELNRPVEGPSLGLPVALATVGAFLAEGPRRRPTACYSTGQVSETGVVTRVGGEVSKAKLLPALDQHQYIFPRPQRWNTYSGSDSAIETELWHRSTAVGHLDAAVATAFPAIGIHAVGAMARVGWLAGRQISSSRHGEPVFRGAPAAESPASLALSPDGRWAATVADGFLQTFRMPGGQSDAKALRWDARVRLPGVRAGVAGLPIPRIDSDALKLRLGRPRKLRGDTRVLAIDRVGGFGFRYVLTADNWTGCVSLLAGREPVAGTIGRRRATHASILGTGIYVVFEGDSSVSRWVMGALAEPIEMPAFTDVGVLALDGLSVAGRGLLAAASRGRAQKVGECDLLVFDAVTGDLIVEEELPSIPSVLRLDRDPTDSTRGITVWLVGPDGRIKERVIGGIGR